MLEAARNVACAGGEPLGLTDCLNFGNPEKPEIAWELAEAIEGMARAAEALRIPGRLRERLALQRDRRPRDPADAGRRLRRARPGRDRDSRPLARGRRRAARRGPDPTLAWSEYQALYGEPGGPRPRLDLGAERALVEFLWRSAPVLSLAHDVSDGGLAVALAEAALWSGVGAEVELPDDLPAWFGEGGGQAVIACAREDVSRLEGAPLRELGVVGGDRLLERRRCRSSTQAWSGH